MLIRLATRAEFRSEAEFSPSLKLIALFGFFEILSSGFEAKERAVTCSEDDYWRHTS